MRAAHSKVSVAQLQFEKVVTKRRWQRRPLRRLSRLPTIEEFGVSRQGNRRISPTVTTGDKTRRGGGDQKNITR